MKKLESNLLNMFLSMLIICSVMSFALGFVYINTKDVIEASAQKKETQAVAQVLPEFNNQPVNEKFVYDELDFFPAKKDGSETGMAVKTFSDNGFSGRIILMVGIDSTGKILNVVVMQQKETPGLGTKMEEPKFKEQFFGRNPRNFRLSVKKDGGDVDAITAATISSRAFCEAVNKACRAYENYRKNKTNESNPLQ